MDKQRSGKNSSSSSDHTVELRSELTKRLFPAGIPGLWCPLLSHFSGKGTFDEFRIHRHLQNLSPHAKGILLPGSTGEGWEMDDRDIQQLLGIVLNQAKNEGIKVLIGVLKTDLEAMLRSMDAVVSYLKQRAGMADAIEAMKQFNVVGFTVCPPKGSHLTQEEIASALTRVAERGFPIALYQLPQITENEMTVETVQSLSGKHPNIYLLKDTSGNDRIALSGQSFHGIFLVRGAEGNYSRWPKSSGGPYDGLLLSTANVFARELHAVLGFLDQGATEKADELSARLTRVVEGCFELVKAFPTGNAFTNANKTIDHIMAFGNAAVSNKPPLLYSGVRLPDDWIEKTVTLLRENDLMPGKGYLED